MAVLQSEPQYNHLALPLLKISQKGVDVFPQHNGFHIALRRDHVVVRHEITQVGIVLLTNGRFKGSRLPGNLHDFHNLIFRHIKSLCQFCNGRLIAQLQRQLSLHLGHLVDGLYHMHRYSDCPRLICQSPCNGLADPPCSICT